MADIAPDHSTTMTLDLGESLESAVDFTGDTDLIRVELSVGQIYVVDLVGAASGLTLFDPVVTLLDSNLTAVAFNDDNAANLDAQITYVTQAGGTYYIQAASYSEQAGTYRLTLTQAADDDLGQSMSSSGHLSVGGSSAGTIDFFDDRDWFRVELTADTTYNFALRGSTMNYGTLEDPALALFDEAGALISANDDGPDGTFDSLLYFTPLVSGTYYLEASGFGWAQGSYRLSAVADDHSSSGSADTAGSSSGELAADSGTADTITEPEDIDTIDGIASNGTVDGGEGADESLSTIDAPTPRDFNGDGKADLVWRHVDGELELWTSTAEINVFETKPFADIGSEWQIRQIADFNGDGRADLVWRNTDGTTLLWNSTAEAGVFAGQEFNDIGNEWQVRAGADFNGDGKADLLWRNVDGTTMLWNTTPSGEFAGQEFNDIGNEWQIQQAADFNGDDKADILWRNDDGTVVVWNTTSSGEFAGLLFPDIGNEWKVQAAADFNGDDMADLIWRNTDGTTVLWTATGAGQFAGTEYHDIGNEWQVAGAADYNGDGRADLSWRNAGGTMVLWTATETPGQFTGQEFFSMSSDWHLV